MAEFVRVMAESDLPPGKGAEALVAGKPVAVFNVGGAFHALTNACPHRGGPLGQGMLDGSTVTCPWHAWSYDVTTGFNTANPDLQLPCYETKVEGGQVFVKIE
jgi:nitrite reductase (NADH) small subunit